MSRSDRSHLARATKAPSARRPARKIVLLDAFEKFLKELRDHGYSETEVSRVQWAFTTGLNTLSSYETFLLPKGKE